MDNIFKKFQELYPNLFKEYPRSGFDLRPGWETLAHSLCPILEYQISDQHKEDRGDFYCAQLKQKFGSLRFYMSQETDYMSGAIAMAEAISSSICEECGERGKIRPGGWTETLCDVCFEKRDKRKTM